MVVNGDDDDHALDKKVLIVICASSTERDTNPTLCSLFCRHDRCDRVISVAVGC